MRALAPALLVFGVAAPALSQTAPSALPGSVEPGRLTNPNLQRPQARPPEAKLQFSFPAQRKSNEGRSSDQLRFEVKSIQVEGATAVGPDFWDPLIAPLLTRKITLPEVIGVADAIQARYVALGYALARAYVPPQEVQDGALRIRVVEGGIARARVEGADAATARRLERVVQPALGEKPARAETIERVLLLAGDRPGLVVTGLLKPSEEPGMADLVLSAAEKPWAVTVGGGNRATQFSGPWTLFGDVAANNRLGFGEQLGVTLSGAPKGLEQFTANGRYLQPVSAGGMLLTTTGSYGRGKPGAGLKPFAVRTVSQSVGQRLSVPLLRARQQNLSLEAGWTVQRARINLLGSRFSTDNWRTVDLNLAYSQAGFLRGGTVASVGVIKGLGILGASRKGAPDTSRLGADPSFTKLVAELQRVQPIAGPVTLLLTAGGQYTGDTLHAGEEFGLGGARFGRGYNGSDLSGASGLGASAEVNATWEVSLGPLTGVTGYGFYDWGRVWQSATADTFLRSAGGGVRLKFGAHTLSLEVAQALRKLPVVGAQDPGTRFFLEVTAAF